MRTIRKMARESNVSKDTMARVLKDDLGLKSSSVTRCQTLTGANRAARVEKAKKTWIKEQPWKNHHLQI